MKPYFQEGDIQVWLGDCRDILPHVGRFDLCLTDPPYGLEGHNMRAAVGYMDVSWDESVAPMEAINGAIGAATEAIIWGGNYYPLPPARCWLLWDKEFAEGLTFADFEMAWTSLDSVARLYRKRSLNVDGGKVHPTQKPLALMLWCISKAKNPQSVIDPFLGSGTTLAACKKLGIRGVGIEREEKYCEIAVRRILNTTPSLFSEER